MQFKKKEDAFPVSALNISAQTFPNENIPDH